MKLTMADGLKLPIEAATQTLLIFGKRGSGKSSTATRFAEQLVAAGVPIAVLDPVDVWWGLKAGRDGKREGGLDVYVFGGAHQDLPLALADRIGVSPTSGGFFNNLGSLRSLGLIEYPRPAEVAALPVLFLEGG